MRKFAFASILLTVMSACAASPGRALACTNINSIQEQTGNRAVQVDDRIMAAIRKTARIDMKNVTSVYALKKGEKIALMAVASDGCVVGMESVPHSTWMTYLAQNLGPVA